MQAALPLIEREVSAPMTTTTFRPRLSPAWVLVLAFLVEFLLFDRFGSHRVTPWYPRWNDQIQYLSECYTGYEYSRAHGLAAGLWHTLVNPSAQGTLHDFAAVIAFQFVGPSRSAALSLNMLALIAWQAALFLVVLRASRSRPLAIMAAMLPLMSSGPWMNVPGSAYDFRLDHFAMCALGVTSALAVAGNRFGSRGASILFGIATGVTLLTRFITGTYFVVVFCLFAAWLLSGNDRGRRFANLAIAALIAAAMAGPIFWLNREWVWNYYYIGHYVGPESAIRNQNYGLVRSLEFVFGWLGTRHLGVAFGLFAGAVAITLAAIRLAGRTGITPANVKPGEDENRTVMDTIVPGAVFLVAPALVLILHPQKQEVVLSAIVPGIVIVIVGAWWLIAGTSLRRPGRKVVQSAVAGSAMVAALAYFASRQLVPFDSPESTTRLRQVNTVADYIFDHSKAAGIERPKIACDHITDAIDAQVLRVVVYERHHVWKDFEMTLPTGIAESDNDLVRQRIESSDFVFMTADDAPIGVFPFDRQLNRLRPGLRAWCEANLHAALTLALDGHPIVLFERGPNVSAHSSH